MVGIGGINLNETIKWVEYLETINHVLCYLMVTPLYAKPGAIGQYKWFKALLDKSSRPSMLYNIPSRAGVALSVEAVGKLKDHHNFWAIKSLEGGKNVFFRNFKEL